MIQSKTLNELIDDGAFLPTDLITRINTYFPNTNRVYSDGYTVGRMFRVYFGDWRPVTADWFVWIDMAVSRAALVGMHYDQIMSQYNTLIDSFVTTGGTITRDSTRTIKNYPSPNGDPSTAYVTSMGTDGFTETETETGRGDENIERLTQLDKITKLFPLVLREFESLFIGRWAI